MSEVYNVLKGMSPYIYFFATVIIGDGVPPSLPFFKEKKMREEVTSDEKQKG